MTIERIAAGAGISRSAFYLHFSDKHELLVAALDDVWAELERLSGSRWSGDGPPAEIVREAVASLVSVHADNAELLRLVSEVATYDDEVRERWLAFVEAAVASAAEYVRRERRAGLVQRTVAPRPTCEALVWMTERCCDVYLRSGGRTPEELVEMLSPVWTAALYPGVTPAEDLRPNSHHGGRRRGTEPEWPAWEQADRERRDSEPGEKPGEGTGASF